MKKLGIILGLCFLPLGGALWADPTLQFWEDSFVALGSTSYDTTFSSVSSTYGNYNGESKLEFNLNATMIGLGVRVSPDKFPAALRVEYAFSVAGDGQTLRDRDWIYNPGYNAAYGTLVGDTTSTGISTPAQFFQASLQAPLAALGKDGGVRLGAEAGFESRHWGLLKVYNYSGYDYQFFTNSGQQPVSDVSATPILSYEITTHSYFGGLRLEGDLGGGWRGQIGARAGFCDFSDFDDHFLDQRTAVGAGSGFDCDFDLDLGLALGGGWDLSAKAGILSLWAWGTQTQTSQVFPFGTNVINDEVESFQVSAGLQASFSFNL